VITRLFGGVSGFALGLALFAVADPAVGGSYRILHTFVQTDGSSPLGGLISDSSGNRYGTTSAGGSNACYGQAGCGTVFKLASSGAFSSLYDFGGELKKDGDAPYSALVADAAGNLYGTTELGGGVAKCYRKPCGTVFRLTTAGSESLFFTFRSSKFGQMPIAGLTIDRSGNLYGTTVAGGRGACDCGTVFEIKADGKEKVLHSFKGGSDGSGPWYAGVILDASGNLYGTTVFGGGTGCGGAGCGTVFKITPNGTETVLYAFAGGSDGANPEGGLLADGAGNIYGVTQDGGGTGCDGGCGTVFKISSEGVESVLHAFAGGNDGGYPEGALIEDNAGNLFGTTVIGGDTGCTENGGAGCGTLFQLEPDGTETVLHAFAGGTDGVSPQAGLMADSAGDLFGTTLAGGNTDCSGLGCGTVFELSP